MAPGFWGIPSSTIDWCEENYAVTHYVAEFWNTVSNLLMIVAPMITAYNLVKQRLEHSLIACHLSLLSVGIGSWCFHMTLLYSMQLLDEMPMIWGSAFLVYALHEIESPPGKSNVPLQIGLFLYCSIVTIVYIACNIPIFFQAAYGLMVASMIIFGAKIIWCLPWCKKKLFIAGLTSYTLGFILWNIDNSLCSSLSSVREYAGVLGPIFEFHAWWHIGAGLGTYLGLLFIAHTRCLVLKQKAGIKYWLHFWPYLSLPKALLHQQNGTVSTNGDYPENVSHSSAHEIDEFRLQDGPGSTIHLRKIL